MKLNGLQIKRALSAALFVLLLIVAGMKNAFAQNQVATLQHNDTITGVYYGEDAFISAHDAAVNGDIITLSSGTFNCCNITKTITIHGAGCEFDSLTQVMPTIISGDFGLSRSNISFEGINATGTLSSYNRNNIVFVKCNINKVSPTSSIPLGSYSNKNWQFINCIIKEFVSYKYTSYLNGSTSCSFTGMSLINSVVRFIGYNNVDEYNPATINNSIILFNNGGQSNNAQAINNIIAYNSIIVTGSGRHTISNCSFFNCIGIKIGETSLFEGQTTSNVMEVNSYEAVFETFTGTIICDNIYQLKEEIATTFIGSDGTEVGIYGGLLPYRTRPGYMIIKNCNVAGRTTEDNKLGVEIELLDAGE